MQFWADVSRQVPALAKLAHLVPSVPASSALLKGFSVMAGLFSSITSSLNWNHDSCVHPTEKNRIELNLGLWHLNL